MDGEKANYEYVRRLAAAWPHLSTKTKARIYLVLIAGYLRQSGWDWYLAITGSLAVSLLVEAESGLLAALVIFFAMLNSLRATLLYQEV